MGWACGSSPDGAVLPLSKHPQGQDRFGQRSERSLESTDNSLELAAVLIEASPLAGGSLPYRTGSVNSRPPHSGQACGSGAACTSSMCSGTARCRWTPCSSPDLRPGGFGSPACLPLEKGAAWRLPDRCDASSALVSRSTSPVRCSTWASSSSTRCCRRLQFGHSGCGWAHDERRLAQAAAERKTSFGAVNKYGKLYAPDTKSNWLPGGASEPVNEMMVVRFSINVIYRSQSLRSDVSIANYAANL